MVDVATTAYLMLISAIVGGIIVMMFMAKGQDIDRRKHEDTVKELTEQRDSARRMVEDLYHESDRQPMLRLTAYDPVTDTIYHQARFEDPVMGLEYLKQIPLEHSVMLQVLEEGRERFRTHLVQFEGRASWKN